MTATHAITVLGIVAALLIAYWQRQLMRQIEMYRRDPSVGLKPAGLRSFVGRYAFLILAGVHGGGLLFVLHILRLRAELGDTAMTPWTVVQIAYFVAAGVGCVVMYMVEKVVFAIDKLIEMSGLVGDFMHRSVDVMSRTSDIVGQGLKAAQTVLDTKTESGRESPPDEER